jgi:hypothetical protein
MWILIALLLMLIIPFIYFYALRTGREIGARDTVEKMRSSYREKEFMLSSNQNKYSTDEFLKESIKVQGQKEFLYEFIKDLDRRKALDEIDDKELIGFKKQVEMEKGS